MDSKIVRHKAHVEKLAKLIRNNAEIAASVLESINNVRDQVEQLSSSILIRALSASTILLIELSEQLDPTILFISDTLEQQIFGYFPGELRGQQLSTLMPDSIHIIHQGHMQRFIESPKNRSMGDETSRLVARKKDGTEFKIEVLIQVFGEAGKLYAVANINPNRMLNETGLTNSGIWRMKDTLSDSLHE